MEGATARHQSRLRIDYPAGWHPREFLELNSEVHADVRIEAWALRVGPSDAAAVAVTHADALVHTDRQGVTGLTVEEATPIGSDTDALQRWIAWTNADGNAVRQITTYRLEDGHVVQASAVGPATYVAASAEELTRLLASVTRREHQPRTSTAPHGDALSAFVDGDIGLAPSTSTPVPHPGLRPLVLTAEEATAFAKGAGAGAMPGVVPMSDEGSLRAGRRSLAARGIVERHDAVVEAATEHAATLRACLEPSARWSLQRRTSGGQVSMAFCSLDDLTVMLRATMPGVYELIPQVGDDAVDSLAAAAQLVESPRATAGSAVWLEPSTFESLLRSALAGEVLPCGVREDARPLADALRTLESVVRVRVVHRSGDRQAAADITWLDAREHGLWGTQPRTARDQGSQVTKALVGIAPTDRETIVAALRRCIATGASPAAPWGPGDSAHTETSSIQLGE